MNLKQSITIEKKIGEKSSTFSFSSDKADEILLQEIATGNRSAFAELVQRHTKKFYHLSYRMIFNKNDAEDIVQDCFIKLWKKPTMWQKGKNTKFTTWFYRVVSNACIDHNRKHSRVFHMEKEELIEDDRKSVDKEMYKTQQEKMIQSVIIELPEKQQKALTLSYYEELSNKETAEIMQTTVKAVESLLVRARKTLKDKITKRIEEVEK